MSSIWTLRRSATDSKASGLCGGLAAHWNVDPVLVRLGAVILALSGGIGVVLYVAGWLLIPVAGQAKAPIDDVLGEQARKIPREAWIVIVAVLCMVFFAAFGALTPFGVGPVLVLAAVWYFGFYRKRSRAEAEPEPAADALPQPLQDPAQDTVGNPFAGPPTAFTEAARAWQARIAEYERARAGQPPTQPGSPQDDPTRSTGAAPPAFPAYPHRAPAHGTAQRAEPTAPEPTDPTPVDLPTAPPPPEVTYFSAPDPVGLYSEPAPVAVAANEETVTRRGDSRGARRLRLVSIVVLGLAMAGLGVASYLGVTVPVLAWLSAALLVVSLTLVASAFVGRPRGTMVTAIILAVSVVCTGLAGLAVGPDGPIAPYSVRYASLAAMPATQTREAGTLAVDLSAVDVTEDQQFAVGVDLGTVRLLVPEDENVVINYSVDLGSVDVLDGTDSGSDLSGSVENIVDEDEPVLTIDARVDAGTVEVVSG